MLGALLVFAYAVSGWRPFEVPTWWMEVGPVFAALPLVLWIDRRIRFTPLALRLLFVEALVVALGAHYTYARVPLGDWMGDLFGFERNHYDRLAHFLQGFVPAIAVREILLKTSPLGRGRWLWVLVTACCLSMSALYELLEWWAALAFGDGATAFLGTQGDPWDTQWDMFLALAGATVALASLSGRHDAEMRAADLEASGHRRAA